LENFTPPERLLLLVGHELTGVPHTLLSCSDSVLKIAMLGSKESLNVAVAAGVALWHMRFFPRGKP
jgi:tRNA G18 (ribose-2'-O)-methylase SpoU